MSCQVSMSFECIASFDPTFSRSSPLSSATVMKSQPSPSETEQEKKMQTYDRGNQCRQLRCEDLFISVVFCVHNKVVARVLIKVLHLAWRLESLYPAP